MKKSSFTDSRVIALLRQAEVDTPELELCREHSIGDPPNLSCTISVTSAPRNWRASDGIKQTPFRLRLQFQLSQSRNQQPQPAQKLPEPQKPEPAM
ncbi:hypothetical protein [Xanthomonas prunicola]|uniref:hypothetical protein n=1 Tax=Xanthomonas prunicola TaxID=2053930 RepID=UPI000C7001D9|nr:hypothetical protein [Xanthomonas prunicola]